MRFSILGIIFSFSTLAAQTPAERKIAAAEASVAKNPEYADGYANLALSLAMRAREVSDTAYYDGAQKAIEKALTLDKTNFAALKAQAWVLLGRHEFAKALTVATELNQRAGDDVIVYGFLSDANTELGNYEKAEKATQWMLDLKPGNVPALTRTAHLRELFGDAEGAFEAMKIAYEQLSTGDTEDRAWVLTQMANLRLAQGQVEPAEKLASEALATFPDYHYALGALAKVRRAQKRYPESVKLERQRFNAAPHPENLYLFAQALELAGEKEEAAQAFTDFERGARAEMNGTDNANHELIFYYADHAHKPSEALKVAQLEFAQRQDVHTLHAYAWAQHVAGNHVEGKKQMERALSVGIRDAEMYRHAGEIALRLKDNVSAKAYFKKAEALTVD